MTGVTIVEPKSGDFRIGKETAQAIRQLAAENGLTPRQVMEDALRQSLRRKASTAPCRKTPAAQSSLPLPEPISSPIIEVKSQSPQPQDVPVFSVRTRNVAGVPMLVEVEADDSKVVLEPDEAFLLVDGLQHVLAGGVGFAVRARNSRQLVHVFRAPAQVVHIDIGDRHFRRPIWLESFAKSLQTAVSDLAQDKVSETKPAPVVTEVYSAASTASVPKTRTLDLRRPRKFNREYRFLSPAGRLVIDDNLMRLCKMNDLPHSTMWKVHKGMSGECHGWRKA